MNLPTIPKIYALGTRFNAQIFDNVVQVEEKIDGSQFSFGNVKGNVECRSKGQPIDPADPGMFKSAVDYVRTLTLFEGVVYQCEFLAKAKHNVLAYSRTPKNNLVLFDVRTPSGAYLNNTDRGIAAINIGIEPVKTLFQGRLTQFTAPAAIAEWHNTESQLGGVKIEGVVIKNYIAQHPESTFSTTANPLSHPPMTAKVVSEAYKERVATVPKNPKAGPGEVEQRLVNALRTEARWLKAIQHLREAGKLVDDNRDIGPLCKEIQTDILAEETDWIKQQLFDEFSKDILRGVVNGFAQFYQKLLANGPSVYQEFYHNTKPTLQGV
jgi:hypothetical protein